MISKMIFLPIIVKVLFKLNEDNSKVMLDQNDLETVIPVAGRQVLVLSGNYRGYKAILENLDVFPGELEIMR